MLWRIGCSFGVASVISVPYDVVMLEFTIFYYLMEVFCLAVNMADGANHSRIF